MGEEEREGGGEGGRRGMKGIMQLDRRYHSCELAAGREEVSE